MHLQCNLISELVDVNMAAAIAARLLISLLLLRAATAQLNIDTSKRTQ